MKMIDVLGLRITIERGGRVWLWWIHDERGLLDHGCEYSEADAEAAALCAAKVLVGDN